MRRNIFHKIKRAIVGTCLYTKNTRRTHPHFKEFTHIIAAKRERERNRPTKRKRRKQMSANFLRWTLRKLIPLRPKRQLLRKITVSKIASPLISMYKKDCIIGTNKLFTVCKINNWMAKSRLELFRELFFISVCTPCKCKLLFLNYYFSLNHKSFVNSLTFVLQRKRFCQMKCLHNIFCYTKCSEAPPWNLNVWGTPLEHNDNFEFKTNIFLITKSCQKFKTE